MRCKTGGGWARTPATPSWTVCALRDHRRHYSESVGVAIPNRSALCGSALMWRAVSRGIEIELRDIISVSRAAAITGPRQAGKSTLARQLQVAGLVPNYFTLDDEPTRKAALADPDGFALSLPRPAVIDEV